MFTLTKQDAEDYLDIYRGEYQDFYSALDNFISGPVIVMEIRGEHIVTGFKEIATHINSEFNSGPVEDYPLHCTGLEGEGEMEAEFFFKLV